MADEAGDDADRHCGIRVYADYGAVFLGSRFVFALAYQNLGWELTVETEELNPVAMRWYIVHAYSNFEHKVKSSLEERIKTHGPGRQVR